MQNQGYAANQGYNNGFNSSHNGGGPFQSALVSPTERGGALRSLAASTNAASVL